MNLDKTFRFVCICLTLIILPLSFAEAGTTPPGRPAPEVAKVIGVVADCYVANFGQTVRSFEITEENPDAAKELLPEDFIIQNAAVTFEYGLLAENSVRSVKVDGNKVLLEVDNFLLLKSGGEVYQTPHRKEPCG
jgi:hypothetical protein